MKRLFYCNICPSQVFKNMLFLRFRPLQHSGKCGMTSRFAMETRIHFVKCYASKEACRLSLTHRSVDLNMLHHFTFFLISCCLVLLMFCNDINGLHVWSVYRPLNRNETRTQRHIFVSTDYWKKYLFLLNISFHRLTSCLHKCWQRLLANPLERVSKGSDVSLYCVDGTGVLKIFFGFYLSRNWRANRWWYATAWTAGSSCGSG